MLVSGRRFVIPTCHCLQERESILLAVGVLNFFQTIMSKECGGSPPEVGSFEAGIGKVEGALRPRVVKEHEEQTKKKEQEQLANVFEVIGKAGEVQGALDDLALLAEEHESLRPYVEKKLKEIKGFAREHINSKSVEERKSVEKLLWYWVNEIRHFVKYIQADEDLRDGLKSADGAIKVLMRLADPDLTPLEDFIQGQVTRLTSTADTIFQENSGKLHTIGQELQSLKCLTEPGTVILDRRHLFGKYLKSLCADRRRWKDELAKGGTKDEEVWENGHLRNPRLDKAYELLREADTKLADFLKTGTVPKEFKAAA